MAALTHPESRRLYSWWWSSHISPKNSKWLQENLTGMDAKVKAMIKLIEEDADSFARRAEMYYKKRPELMKMVEEFYRAYRALAERYDHAMGELRQAHRTMADAFSNQMPFLIPEESMSASSDTELPQSPVNPHPIQSLLDFDDLEKGTQQSSPHSHVMRRDGAYSEDGEHHKSRKGLKQLNAGSVGSETSFLAEEKSSSNYKEAELKEEEVKKLQDELSKLSSENQSLASRILLATEHSDKVKTEVQSLRNSLSTLETEKASAIHQYEQCLKKVSSLEAEISEERTFTGKLNGFEERCHFLETLNQSLQLEVDALLHKAELQEKEILDKQEELKKLDSLIKEEQLSSTQAKEALHSLERLQGQFEEDKRILVSELGAAKENLREVTTMKRELEQAVQKIKENNHGLQEHNLSSDLIIKNLQDEILSLKEAKQGLEEEVRLLMSKQSALQQQLSWLKGNMEDLARQHKFLIEQIESVGFSAETFHSSIKELQDETSKLKSSFVKEKDEKLNLLNKLGEMEKVLEKCSLLDSSLSDAHNELDVLRQNLKGQAESFLSLQTEKSDLQAEKNLLISQVDHIAENLKQSSVKNARLENSLSDLTVELDGFRVKSKDLEESSLSLQSENSRLLSERDDLATQVETIQASLEDLERKFSELEDGNSCLHEEKELALQQINELELLLAQKNKEHSLFAESSNSQLVNLEHQVGALQAEVALRNKEIEEEQEGHFAAHTEVLVLQSCIIDMKQQNDGLFGEFQVHNEELLNVKNHVSELQTEVLELKEKVKLMVQKKLKQRVVMNQVLRLLGMEIVENYDGNIEDHKVLLQLSAKVENLQWSLQNAEEDIEQLVFERSINNLVLKEMRHEGLILKSKKESLEHNLKIKMEELSFLRNDAGKLLEMEKLLQKEIEASMLREAILKTERDKLSSQLSEVRKAHLTLANENYELLEENQSWKKEFCFLRDEKYILEEEYTALFKEALYLRCLSLIFEKISSEKATELRELCSEVENLCKVNCDLKEVSEMTGERVRDLELENVLLMETVVKLEDYRSKSVELENELLRIKGHTEELNSKIELGKQLLNQQEIDLSDAVMKIEAKNVENMKLQDDVITLKEECFEAKLLIESLQQSLTLAENKARYDEKHYMELLGRKECLMSKLKRNINEVEIWEKEAVELYKGLQVSGVIALVFEQKAFELGRKCESLQEHFMGRMENCELNKALRDGENEKMKAKLFALELENEELKHEVAVVLPLIISLKDTIFRLEEQALSFTKLHDKEMQIPNSSYDQQTESVCQNGRTMKPSELLGSLQEKVHTAVIAVLESKAYFMEENAKANEQLETAKMEIEELKGRIKMMPGDVGSTRSLRLLKDEGDISHTRMKDIQLDHVSNRSSPRLTSDVYAGPIHQSEEIESFNFEKDLAVDKIELSRLSGGTQEGSRRILEKVVSDTERLENIQASVLDMENRIGEADKDKLTSFEYNSLMAQLREIEGVISQLLEMRGKLVKAAEEETMGTGRKIKRVDERGLSRGRQVSEQARRWSEKIARMELEVQQIRFLLFKLEEEYDGKGKKTLERRRVQLRDYLYGATYDNYRKKKRYLCACMEPSTKED